MQVGEGVRLSVFDGVSAEGGNCVDILCKSMHA